MWKKLTWSSPAETELKRPYFQPFDQRDVGKLGIY